MSTDKIDPSNKDGTISPADDLVKTSKSGDVELSEEELKRVTGGSILMQKCVQGEHLKDAPIT